MDPQLNDYKNAHRARYIEREQARELTAKLAQELEQNIDTHCKIIGDATQLTQLQDVLKGISNIFNIQNPEVPFPNNLQEKGMSILENINGNSNLKINVTDTNEVELSKSIQDLTKTVLAQFGIEAGEMQIEYDMDTSRDEEIAKELAASMGPQRIPPRPRRRRVAETPRDEVLIPPPSRAPSQPPPQSSVPAPVKRGRKVKIQSPAPDTSNN